MKIILRLHHKRKLCLRVLCICLSTLFFCPPLAAQDQKVNFPKTEMTLREAFAEVEKQTGMTIAYISTTVDVGRTVTITTNGRPLSETMSSLLKGTKTKYKIVGRQILISPDEPIRITGKVTGENNEPLAGVSIYSKKDNALGTSTDNNGEFRMTVPEGTTLIVSYIGYIMQEVPVGNRVRLDISLVPDSQQIEELVVVGYGVQKKVNLLGAVSQVGGDDFKDRPVTNIGQALQGMVPNLNITFGSAQPGASGSFNIRGNTSPNGGSPLILIDGMETNINRINSNDIESISVLKDASSAAIYGARGVFGVILITTKSGSKEQKPTVSYSGHFSISKPTTSTDYETRGYYSAKIADMFMMNNSNTPYTSYTEADYQALWERRNDKTEHPDRPWVITERRGGMNQYVYLANFDWYNYLYDDRRPTHDHNLNISGGTKTVSYMLSGRFTTQKGVTRLNPDRYTSYNLRSKISADIKPWFRLTNNTKFFSSAYNYYGRSGESDNWRQAALHGLASFVPVNPDGTLVTQHSGTRNAGHVLMDGWSAMMHTGTTKGTNGIKELTTKFDAEFRIIDGLKINADFGYTLGYLRNNYRRAPVYYSKYPGIVSQESDSSYPDRYDETVWDQQYYATNAYATYTKSFNEKHNLNVIAGFNYEQKNYIDLGASHYNLLSEELSDFNLAVTGSNSSITGGKNQYALMGAYFRASYDFMEKYLVEINGRYDGTSRFLKNDRWGFFPSASLGYRISEEEFFEPARRVVDNLKIRASYGSLGNQALTAYYPFIENINTGKTMKYSFDGTSLGGVATIDPANDPSMTWETVISKNIGLDLSMFRNRLNLTLDGYIRDTKKILAVGEKLPSIYGQREPYRNADVIRTNGYEIVLTWRDQFKLAGRPFKYSITGIFSDYTAKYLKVDNPTGLIYDPYEGKSIGEIWGYRIGGLFATDAEAAAYAASINSEKVHYNAINGYGNGHGIRAGDMHYLDLNGDNEISQGNNTFDDKGDREVIGNSQPRFNYGATLSFEWLGFDLSMFFQGIGRMHWYPGSDNQRFWGPYSRPYPTFLPADFMGDVWSPSNPDAYLPVPRAYSALTSGNQLYWTNDRYLQNLAYFRLKNLTFGYTIPEHLTQKAGISNLRVYFSGDNLFTLTKLRSKYIDPEEASAATNKNNNVYRWAKTFAFGLNLTF